jgi:phosphoglucosamine mutase
LRERFTGLDLSGLRILVDCANGGGSGLVPEVLASFGAEAIARNEAPDGTNINAGCGALHPERIAAEVTGLGCQLALCLDGDGDRAIFVDEHGRVVHGDALLTLMALAFAASGELRNRAVAVTVMSNLGLKRAVGSQQIRVFETPVGDRSVVAAMLQHDLTLGGENSGHIIFGDEHNHTGDGLYTCLKLLEILVRTEQPLSELTACFSPYPQKLVNVVVSAKPPLMSLPLVVQTYKEVERELGDDGRVVLRYSGTENLCRVMVEAASSELVDRAVERLVSAVESSVGG